MGRVSHGQPPIQKNDHLHRQSPNGIARTTQRKSLDTLTELNNIHHENVADPEIMTRLAQYELAYKMQASVPDLADFSGESKATSELYGLGDKPDGSFASNCLMARRMAERGVRFIQLYHSGWDYHGGVVKKQWGLAAKTLIKEAPPSFKTSNNAAFSMTPSSSGVESLAAPRCHRAQAATTTPSPGPCLWPEAESREEWPTARLTPSASPPKRSPSMSTTSTPLPSTSSASSTRS